MGVRLRKSFKLAPGLRMNVSGSGISWTLGPRGASVSIGKRGTFLNAGLPGTGLYTRERLDGSTRSQTYRAPAKTASMSITVGVKDDGTVYFCDDDGNPLPDRLVTMVKKQKGDAIRELIQKKCDEINGQIQALGEIHLYTPSPHVKPTYEIREYQDDPPRKPTPKKPGFFASLFKSKRERIERENAERERQYQQDLKDWMAEKERFDDGERRRKARIERDIYTDVAAMELFLEENLQGIVWPRETNVSAEILDGGKRVFIDVDLPEIEDMPSKTASVPQRGYKLSLKDMSPAQVQRLYMRHVHGIGFRIIGEAFAALPVVQEIILSAFSQRQNAATSQTQDDYLYSVRVERDAWSQIRFGNLQYLDIIESLAQFDLRRNMTKPGVFKAIEPFPPAHDIPPKSCP
jgi:hypothetical protein